MSNRKNMYLACEQKNKWSIQREPFFNQIELRTS